MTQQQPLQYEKVGKSKLFPEFCRDPWIQSKGARMGASRRARKRRLTGVPGAPRLDASEALPGHLRLRALVGWGGKVGFLFRRRAGNRDGLSRRTVSQHVLTTWGLPGAVKVTPAPTPSASGVGTSYLRYYIWGLWTALLSEVLHLGVYGLRSYPRYYT